MKHIILPILTLIIGLVVGRTYLSTPPHLAPTTAHTMEKSHASPATTHTHTERAIDPSLPVPSLTAKLHPDTMGGYGLQIAVTNFTITPEQAGQASKSNEGHMHVYVNGKKVARMYGEWLYLSADLFTQESNQVDVTLNANDHADWMHGGTHIGATLSVPPHAAEKKM